MFRTKARYGMRPWFGSFLRGSGEHQKMKSAPRCTTAMKPGRVRRGRFFSAYIIPP